MLALLSLQVSACEVALFFSLVSVVLAEHSLNDKGLQYFELVASAF